MSPTGRPEGESLARSDKISLWSPTGRPEGRIFDMALARSDKGVL